MNSLEDRLRAAAHAAAGTVAEGSAAPLRLPPRRTPLRLPSPRGRALTLLAPVAAAVAVVAVVATAVAVRGGLGSGTAPGGPASGLSHAAPRYFVALAHPGRARPQVGTAVAVAGDTATGQVIARVGVPKPYNAFVAVSAAADDRTFVLAAQHLPAQGPDSRPLSGCSPATGFYQLQINPAGQPRAVLTALPLPVLPPGFFACSDSIALSADGTRLAVQLSAPGHHSPSGVRVYDLATGSFRTWYLPRDNESGYPGIGSPSWVGGDRYLAILAYPARPHACAVGCVQLLDTTTPGGNVMAASRTVFRTAALHRLISWNTVLATTDGSRILIAGMAGKKLNSGVQVFYLPVVYEFSARSGHVGWHLTGQRGEDLYPLWASANARFFILARPNRDPLSSVTAAIYGPHGTFAIKLPAKTLDAAW